LIDIVDKKFEISKQSLIKGIVDIIELAEIISLFHPNPKE